MGYLTNLVLEGRCYYLGRSRLTRYAVAALSVAVALLLTLLLQPLVKSTVLSLFFAAVTFSAWYGRLEAGLLATILSILASNFFLTPMADTLALRHGANLLHLLLFSAVALLVSSLNAGLQAAKQRAETNLAKLQLSEERYRRIVDTADEGIWLFNADMQTEYVNQRLAEMLGYRVEEMCDRSICEFLDMSTQVEQWHPDIRERFDCCFRTQDGSQLWAIVSITPVLTKQGKFNGALAMLTDITDRKQAEAQRTQLLEREQASRTQAEAANRIKDEFLAVLSHELRSPLHPILGWAQVLQTKQLDQQTTNYALKTIERNAKLQTKLIEDLLDVSRILRGQLSLEICSVNLVSTIEAAMETVRLAAQEKVIALLFSILDFEWENTDEPPESFAQVQADYLKTSNQKFLVSGDPKRLQQVVWNLLSNAVKFTPPRGQVKIQLSIVNQDSNLEGLTQTSIQIKVTDTGRGIQPDFLPHVFESFRQADNTTSRKFGGLGLGLAIVRHLVELHDGTVEAQSPGEGQGATFTVRLPLLQNIDEAEHLEAPSLLSSGSLLLAGLKILVVDDEPDMRELLTVMLEQYGAIVTAVASAEQALQALVQSEQHLLLSDLAMPEVNGYVLVRQVRASEVALHRQIPAIALTACASEFERQQAQSAGFQKHLAKPVEQAELITAIASLTGRNI